MAVHLLVFKFLSTDPSVLCIEFPHRNTYTLASNRYTSKQIAQPSFLLTEQKKPHYFPSLGAFCAADKARLHSLHLKN